MKKLLLAAMFAAGGAHLAHAQSEPFIGQIMQTGATFCPVGWHVTDGSLLPINQNTPLFSLLGSNYGGDGVSTFGLPNMKPILTTSRATVLQCIALQGVYPSRP